MENQKIGRTVTGCLRPTASPCWPSPAVKLAYGAGVAHTQSAVTAPGSHMWRRGGALAGIVATADR
jgi:hypothetical protein